ncbi:tryptorubin family RiPP precursor [Streptomyces clavuligerus]|nr:tryptorubin family RiPP precursor [Streptomyces clavuligerus]
MTKLLFAIRHKVSEGKSLKGYAWYIWW